MPSPVLTCYFNPPTAVRSACYSASVKHRLKRKKAAHEGAPAKTIAHLANSTESEVFYFSECWNNGNRVGILSKFLFIFNF